MTSHDAQSQGANPSNRSTLATPAAFDDLAPRPVTVLDLLFNLVSVFTITQLTELLVHDLHPRGIVQLLLIFGVSFWMYGGYVWLTNYLPPNRTSLRLVLLYGDGRAGGLSGPLQYRLCAVGHRGRRVARRWG
jgi:hypothetical protein